MKIWIYKNDEKKYVASSVLLKTHFMLVAIMEAPSCKYALAKFKKDIGA